MVVRALWLPAYRALGFQYIFAISDISLIVNCILSMNVCLQAPVVKFLILFYTVFLAYLE